MNVISSLKKAGKTFSKIIHARNSQRIRGFSSGSDKGSLTLNFLGTSLMILAHFRVVRCAAIAGPYSHNSDISVPFQATFC